MDAWRSASIPLHTFVLWAVLRAKGTTLEYNSHLPSLSWTDLTANILLLYLTLMCSWTLTTVTGKPATVKWEKPKRVMPNSNMIAPLTIVSFSGSQLLLSSDPNTCLLHLPPYTPQALSPSPWSTVIETYHKFTRKDIYIIIEKPHSRLDQRHLNWNLSWASCKWYDLRQMTLSL